MNGIVLVKTNLENNIVWEKIYDTSAGNCNCYFSYCASLGEVVKTNDKGYLLSGLYSRETDKYWGTILLKTDQNGQIEYCDLAYEGKSTQWYENNLTELNYSIYFEQLNLEGFESHKNFFSMVYYL